MARTVKDANLGTAEARRRLKVQGKPHYRLLEEGLHLGYRRLADGAGKWVARFYAGEQQYAVETFAVADDLSDANGLSVLSFSQAQQKARELRDERDRSAAGKGPYTVSDACRDYLEFIDERRKSAADIRTRLEAFVIPKLGDIEASKLTTDNIEKWLTALAKAPARVRTKKGAQQAHRQANGDPDAQRKRQATANRVWTSLRAALNKAFRAGRILSDTAWRRVEAFKGVDAARERFFTLNECQRLTNASAPDFRRLVMAGLATGARYGELGRLVVSDFDGARVLVRKSKTNKERWIHLNEEGVSVFRLLTAGLAGDALLLTRADGSRWEKNYQQVPMKEAIANARITPAASFHILRHTWISHSVMNGVPLTVVAKNAGHASTAMIEKHYGHLAPSYLANELRTKAPTFGFEIGNVTAIR
jgi:integrase